MFKRFIKRMLCRHENMTFIRNIHGGEITSSGGMRSVWRCNHCHRIVLAKRLNPED